MRSLLAKSIYFDFQTLAIRNLSVGDRISYILKKYLALIRLMVTGEARVEFRAVDMVFHDVGELGTAQSCVVDFYSDIVKPGIIVESSPVVLDIGANIGQYCNAIKLFYPDARITSFEPDPRSYERLCRNTRHLAGVTVINKGVGKARRTLPFYVHELSGMSSFQPYEDYEYGQEQTIPLEVDALDALVDEEHIDLMKVDVEGFEAEVVEGGAETIGKSDYVLIELSLQRRSYAGSNLELIEAIRRAAPAARIVKFGRPLGSKEMPTCQDVLVKVG